MSTQQATIEPTRKIRQQNGRGIYAVRTQAKTGTGGYSQVTPQDRMKALASSCAYCGVWRLDGEIEDTWQVTRKGLRCEDCTNAEVIEACFVRKATGDIAVEILQGKPKIRGTTEEMRARAMQIRELYAAGGISYTGLAKRFGLSRAAIGMILGGKTWKEE